MPWTGRPDRPVRLKGSPTATSAARNGTAAWGRKGWAPPSGRQSQTVDAASGVLPMSASAVSVGAQRGDGDARLRQRLRLSLVDPIGRARPARRSSCAPRVPRRPSRPSSAGPVPSRARGTRTPRRSRAEAPPSCRADRRDGTAATNPSGRRRSATSRPGPRRAGRPTPSGRRPPRCAGPDGWSVGWSWSCSAQAAWPSGRSSTAEASHGMSGWSQATTARRSPAGCGRGVPKKSCPSSSVVSHGDPEPVARATILRTGRVDPSRMRLTDGQHPRAVSRGAQTAVTMRLARRCGRAQGRGYRPVRGAAPSQSHTPWSDWST